MVDIIAWAPDMATLKKAAIATGFTDKVINPVNKKVISETIRHQGTWPGSNGSWALNIVEEPMPEHPGVWARLRWNDDSNLARLEKFIAAVQMQGVTVYRQVTVSDTLPTKTFWSADGGRTQAGEWVGNIGIMM